MALTVGGSFAGCEETHHVAESHSVAEDEGSFTGSEEWLTTHTLVRLAEHYIWKGQTEHKAAVKRQDQNNGIAVHTWKMNHRPDWETASVKTTVKHHWKRRILEALHIQKQKSTINLDCGLHMWKPVIHSCSFNESLLCTPTTLSCNTLHAHAHNN